MKTSCATTVFKLDKAWNNKENLTNCLGGAMPMRTAVRKTAVFLSALSLISVSYATTSVRAQDCPTQGAFALALAQILGFDVTYGESAIKVLVDIGVRPDPEWDAGKCLTAAVIPDIEQDLKAAIDANLLDPRDVAGAIAYALDAIGATEIAGQGMPSLYPRSNPHVGGPPMEGSRGSLPGPPSPPPPPPTAPPPTTTTTQPPASPFIP